MFRFTIRDVLWLTVVPAILMGGHTADAALRTLKKGESVYVRYMNREGYGVVKGSDSQSYEVELQASHPAMPVTRRFPRDSVYESKEHADKRQLPEDDRPPVPDLAPLYQAMGAATCSCGMFVFFVWGIVYVVRQRLRPPTQPHTPPAWPPPPPRSR